MKDLFTGPWDKAGPCVVNLEGSFPPICLQPPGSSRERQRVGVGWALQGGLEAHHREVELRFLHCCFEALQELQMDTSKL